MKSKFWKLIPLILIAVLALAACGGDAAPADEAADEPAVVVDEPAEVVEEPAEEEMEEPAEEEMEEPAEEEMEEPAEEMAEEPVEEAAEVEMEEPLATLRVWADNTRTPILQGLAEAFEAEYGVALVVEELGFGDIRTQMVIAAPAGEGPDIFIGAHDWLGALVESGLVAPMDLGALADEFVPSALQAFTYTDGVLYGLPYATENMGFFYNTELVAEPPTTWDEVLEIGRTLQAEGQVTYATAFAGKGYDALPIQTAFGGYVFGQNEDGSWNPQDVGLDSEGMIAAVTWMTEAAAEGLAPNTFDWDTAHALFETGEIPFLMAGPWALDRIRASEVPYAVTTFPDDGAPFLGVQGFMVNAFSENILLSQAFLTEFVATEEVMQAIFDTGLRPSALKVVLDATDDPDLAAMGEAAVNAIPMPNIPEMGSVWGAWDNGVELAVTGEQSPEEAMTDAANQVRSLILGELAGMVNLPGSYQALAGCGADWDPACEATATEVGDDGLYRLTVEIPAGEYEFKVALDGSWGVNYGSDGAQDGPNYALVLEADSMVSFTYDPETYLVEISTE